MTDKGQWGGAWPGHRGYTPTLYEKCHGIYNDHKESGPRFNISSERRCLLSVQLSLLSTCSWCVVSALAPLSCGSRRIIQVDAAHWWWLRRDPPPPHPQHDCKAHWVYNNTEKALYKCIIHQPCLASVGCRVI